MGRSLLDVGDRGGCAVHQPVHPLRRHAPGPAAELHRRPPSPSGAERLYERVLRELEARGVRVERGSLRRPHVGRARERGPGHADGRD